MGPVSGGTEGCLLQSHQLCLQPFTDSKVFSGGDYQRQGKAKKSKVFSGGGYQRQEKARKKKKKKKGPDCS